MAIVMGNWSSKKVFFLGVKGVMMSNLALICSQMGKKVCGSDTMESQITDQNLLGIKLSVLPLEADIPPDVDLVVYGAAHGGEQSAQVKKAIEKKIKVTTQAQFIADLLPFFPNSIAVCGCHGKTGTSSMLAYTMKSLGMKVSWLIGAPQFRGKDSLGKEELFVGGHYSPQSEYFVFEADEYAVCPPNDKTPKILLYKPTHIICTNIDFDHPDIYEDLEHVRRVFSEFFTHSKNIYMCDSSSIEGNKVGIYNLLKDLGFEKNWVSSAITGYSGVARRLDYYGEHGGVKVFDDYGHHPKEILATITKIRESFKDSRLIVAFQSHTQSRTNMLKNEFVEALSFADVALIDQIFPSAREKDSETLVTVEDLVALAKAKGYENIYGFAKRTELEFFLYSIVKKNDVILTLGAGDIYKIIPSLLNRLKNLK